MNKERVSHRERLDFYTTCLLPVIIAIMAMNIYIMTSPCLPRKHGVIIDTPIGVFLGWEAPILLLTPRPVG